MTYLIDTNPLLWLLDNDSAIPAPTLAQLKDLNTQLFVSIANIWKISIKRSLGQLTINRLIQIIVDELALLRIDVSPILLSYTSQVEALSFYHVESCVSISKDTDFPLYTVPLLWD
nr:hypothetical protein A6C57_04690 [Fibrella sp. ES10-3-2-2]